MSLTAAIVAALVVIALTAVGLAIYLVCEYWQQGKRDGLTLDDH